MVKKHFAILNLATTTSFEVGYNLKGQAPEGRLKAEKPNAMCSHKFSITGMEGMDNEVLDWLEKACEQTG